MLQLRVAMMFLVVGCATSSPGVDDATSDPGGKEDNGSSGTMRLLQTNVGNVELACDPYKYKLCLDDVEASITDSIRSLNPDVVSFQEVVALDQCENMGEIRDWMTCYADHLSPVAEQARRLVGDRYTIACDTRSHYECVAVKRTWGQLANCPDGGFCIDPDVTETAPAVAGCDDGFSVSAVTIVPKHAQPFRLVDLHPPSGNAVDCRVNTLAKVFAGPTPLAPGPRSLLSGDFNLDPFHNPDASGNYLNLWVGPGKPFHFHSGTAEIDPPYKTATYQWPLPSYTYDHVISNFASGVCTTLGQAPDTSRLDGGSGTDHRALFCRLGL